MEVLALLSELNEAERRTIVIVLHDLNMACRYGHHIVAMRAGRGAAPRPGEALRDQAPRVLALIQAGRGDAQTELTGSVQQTTVVDNEVAQ